MNLELLKQILAIPSYSGEETVFARYLCEYLKSQGLKAWVDEHRNVFAIKGQAAWYPCLSAHTDTVHEPEDGVTIVERDGKLIALDQHGRQTGLGGDDKSGVFIVLQALEKLPAAKVALFAGEERGGMGSSQADEDFFWNVGYLLNFDAHGYGFVSYTMGGTKLFDNGGEFICKAMPVLEMHGLNQWQSHPFSDPAVLRKRFTFSILNLSAGYWMWHTKVEYVTISEVARSIDAALELVSVLGNNFYGFFGTPFAPFEGKLVSFRP